MQTHLFCPVSIGIYRTAFTLLKAIINEPDLTKQHTMEKYSHLIAAINKSHHYIWKKKDEYENNYLFRTYVVYVVYLKSGKTKTFTDWMHSNFACQKAIDIVSEIIEEQITMFLSKIGNPQSNTNLPINYIEQKGMKSFNHRNILYEIHSHHVYKRLHMSGQDPFEASYNIILKMQNKYEYFVVCVNGTATGVTRKAAIVAARRAAERETNKYNIGPVKY
jgi:hypothetical protein